MRLSLTLLTATLLTGSLAGCSSGNSVPQTTPISADGSAQSMSAVPVELRSSVILAKIHEPARVSEADAVTPGIYGSVPTYSDSYVAAYHDPDRSNGAPVCTLSMLTDVTNIAVDRLGDLLVINVVFTGKGLASYTVTIFAGPGLCGPELGSFGFLGSAPVDVASLDARSGKIVVAQPGYRAVSVCTLSHGCTILEAPHMRIINGVALAPNGDCWASGETVYKKAAILAYFAHCQGRGVLATGFQNPETFGLDIDENGKLVSIGDPGRKAPSDLYIYSGCNPACKRIYRRSLALRGNVYYGHLDASSKHFVAANESSNQLDVYSYSTRGIRYEYSISNGLTGSVYGAAFSPSSKE